MNSPTVRLEALRYAAAARSTSSGVTLRMRSRFRKKSRQSPAPIHSLICKPTRSAEFMVSSIFFRILARARSTFSFEGGVLTAPAIVWSAAARASSSDWSCRTSARRSRNPGSFKSRKKLETDGAFFASTSALCRPRGGGARGGRAGRHVVCDGQRLDVPDAPQRDRALAVLRGFGGVGRRERPGRARDRREDRVDHRQRLLLIGLGGGQQDGVFGLVVGPPESLEAFDRHVLDVRASPDRVVAVVVPEEGGGEDPLVEHALRVVLAGLELVAHDRHLAVQVLLRDEGADHPVGLEIEGPLEVL